MESLDDLPDEILEKIIARTGRSLAPVSKRFLILYNRYYMKKVSKIVDLDSMQMEAIMPEIVTEVTKLTDIRLPITKILLGSAVPTTSSFTIPPALCCSWYIAYGMMQYIPFIVASPIEEDRIMDGTIRRVAEFGLPRAMVPDAPNMQLNIWIDVRDPSNLFDLARIYTDIGPLYDISLAHIMRLPLQTPDWINEPGLYCFNLGTFKTKFMEDYEDDPCIPFIITTTFPIDVNTSNNAPYRVLGYSFDTYKEQFTHPWIMFRIDSKFKQRFEHIPQIFLLKLVYINYIYHYTDYRITNKLWEGTETKYNACETGSPEVTGRPLATVLWEYPTLFKDGPISIPELCAPRIL